MDKALTAIIVALTIALMISMAARVHCPTVAGHTACPVAKR